MSDKTDTPETDSPKCIFPPETYKAYLANRGNDYRRIDDLLRCSSKLERECDELRKAIRNIISKGYIKADTPLLNALEDAERLLPENLNLASDEKLE